MSHLKYTDHAVSCDFGSCPAVLWGSSIGLRDGQTLAYVRKQARYRGWTSVEVPPAKMDQVESKIADFCPAHSEHGPVVLLA